LQPVLNAVHDLQRWEPAELAAEVRDLIAQIQTHQAREDARRTLSGLESPGELDDDERERLTRALARGKSVKSN